MAFLKALRRKLFPPKQYVALEESGDCSLEVVGESFYQKQLRKICGGKKKDGVRKYVDALLIHDNNNSHDANAIAIQIQGYQVGHLSREDAKTFRIKMKKAGHDGDPLHARAVIVGGKKGGVFKKGTSFGVFLDIPLEERNVFSNLEVREFK
jgi:hypothetical protein